MTQPISGRRLIHLAGSTKRLHRDGCRVGQIVIEADEIVGFTPFAFYRRGHHHAEDVEIDLCVVIVDVYHFTRRQYPIVEVLNAGGIATRIAAGLDEEIVIAVEGEPGLVAEGIGVKLWQVKMLVSIILKPSSAGCHPILIFKWFRCDRITGKQLITLVIATDREIVYLFIKRR